MYKFIVVSIALTLCSCSTITKYDLSDPQVRSAINQIKIMDIPPDEKINVIETVEARYCGNNQKYGKMGHFTREEAIVEMKYKAVQLGANALVNVSCAGSGIHVGTNCNSSIACYGDAVKI